MEKPDNSIHLWRSFLFIPAHVNKFVAKAAQSGADVVVLDLEDGVPPISKTVAREAVLASAATLSSAGTEVAVRINLETELARLDVNACVGENVSIIIIPKVETSEQVCRVADQIDDRQVSLGLNNDHTVLIALIETPLGLLNAVEIAHSHPRLHGLNLGTEDFSFEMGMEPEWDALLYPSQQVAIVAKAAGIVALGYAGSIAQFRDIDAFEKTVKKSSRLGFEGGFAIHPAQVPALNRVFSPSQEAVEQAEKVVTAFEGLENSGIGAVKVDGKMVDLPIANRARQILGRAKYIANREQKQL